MMYTPRSHSSLHHLESPTLPEDDILRGNADVVEDQVRMAVRCIIITVDSKHTLDFNAWSFGRYKNYGLLLVLVGMIRVGLSEDNVDYAPDQ